MEKLGGAETVTVIHHGRSDHQIVTAALKFKEVRPTDRELPKFLRVDLLQVSATVTEVCQWAATELQFPGHTSLVALSAGFVEPDS